MQGVAAGRLNELLDGQTMPKGDLIIQYLSCKGSGLNGKPCIDCDSYFNRNMIRIPSALSHEHLLYQNASSSLHRLEVDLSRK